MRTSIKDLKRMIREAAAASEPELRSIIKAMDPDQVSDDDYIDSETGEVYLEKGKRARTSELHSQYKADREEKRRTRDIERAAEDEHDQAEEDEWEAQHDREHDEAQAAYDTAVSEFVSNWSREDVGDVDDIQGIATDAADGFFYTFPEWRQWSKKLGMSRDDIRSTLADLIYENLLGHNEM